MKKFVLLFALMGSAAIAEPWDIPDGNGGWKPNPACQSASCRETGVPDPKKPPAPIPSPLTPSGGPGNPISQESYCCTKVKKDGSKVKWCVGGADFSTPADRVCGWYIHPVDGVVGDE